MLGTNPTNPEPIGGRDLITSKMNVSRLRADVAHRVSMDLHSESNYSDLAITRSPTAFLLPVPFVVARTKTTAAVHWSSHRSMAAKSLGAAVLTGACGRGRKKRKRTPQPLPESPFASPGGSRWMAWYGQAAAAAVPLAMALRCSFIAKVGDACS